MVELETKRESDDALIARFYRGDEDAFARLYRRHRHGLYGYALSFTGQEARAADAVQELWLGALEDIERLTHVVNVRAYLYRSLRNRLIDEYRRRARERRALEGEAREPRLVKARDTAAAQEQSERLSDALRKLPEEQREVVLLRIYSEMKFADIADVLQENTKTVESRHRLALEKLREWLETTDS